jgi:hypothetical protein
MALGSGVDPAGIARAGLDVIQIPPRYALKPIAAKLFDPKAKAYVVNADGQYVGTHPIDQWVVQQLVFMRGTILAALNVGNAALRYSHIGPDHVAKVTKDLESLLAPRVNANEILVHAIEVAAPQYATLMQVDYTNILTATRMKAEA